MISSLTGEIQHLGTENAVISVSGVGYVFSASPNTLSALRLGQDVTVQTLLLIRDDNPVLYGFGRSEEHTSELQSRGHLVCRLLLEKKKKNITKNNNHVRQATYYVV